MTVPLFRVNAECVNEPIRIQERKRMWSMHSTNSLAPCCAFGGKLLSQGRYLAMERASRSLNLLSSVNSRDKNWARPALSCAPRESSLRHDCKCFSNFRFDLIRVSEWMSAMKEIISFMCSFRQSAVLVWIYLKKIKNSRWTETDLNFILIKILHSNEDRRAQFRLRLWLTYKYCHQRRVLPVEV